jgi:hypothetical protein
MDSVALASRPGERCQFFAGAIDAVWPVLEMVFFRNRNNFSIAEKIEMFSLELRKI